MGKKNEVPETEGEKALAEVSIKKWNDHQLRMVPLENKVIEGANRNPHVADVKAAGAVNADVAQASAARVNPNTGAVYSAPSLSVAKASAKATVDAGQTVHDQRASALGNVVALGEGKAATATAGFETAAANATNKAISEAAAKEQTKTAYVNAAGSVAGATAYGAMKSPAIGAGPDQLSKGANGYVYNNPQAIGPFRP